MATLTSPPVPPPTAAPQLPSPHANASPVNSVAASTSAPPTPVQAPPSHAFVPPSEVEGITRLWMWHVPSVPAALTSLTTSLLSVHGATRTGRWWTTCDHLTQKRPAAAATANSAALANAQLSAATKELYCLTFSEQAERCHAISAGVIVTSSAALPSFLTATAGYTSRSAYHVEGDSFALGDFTLSIGAVRHNGRYTSSLLLRLVYAPCCQPLPNTFQLLQGVLESVLAGEPGASEAAASYRPAGGWPTLSDFGLGDVWTARHTAVMWLFVLQMSRAAT